MWRTSLTQFMVATFIKLSEIFLFSEWNDLIRRGLQQKLVSEEFLQLMPKETKKQTNKVFQLLTTPQSNAYKEQVKKQGKTLYAGTESQLDSMMQTTPDTNYLSIYKKQYDKNMDKHQLDVMLENQYSYNPKTKKDRHFNMKQEDETKASYQFPLTANQEYGWREPIDTFSTGYGMKHTFDEKLSTALHTMNQQKKKQV